MKLLKRSVSKQYIAGYEKGRADGIKWSGEQIGWQIISDDPMIARAAKEVRDVEAQVADASAKLNGVLGAIRRRAYELERKAADGTYADAV